MNIVIVGFASCGKSTAAAALCGRAALRHVDLDRMVEERYEQRTGARLAVRQIFKEVGKGGFAALENDALKSLSGTRNLVLSAGGRTPMDTGNRALIKSLGSVVYLRCGVATVTERMKKKGAPLTMGNTPEEIKAEWEKRDPIYSAIADAVVENESLTPDETAVEILKQLPFYGETRACRALSAPASE
jgi:shikimate kinase